MKPLLNLLFFFIQNFLIKKFFKEAKTKGLLVYLNALQLARKSLLASFFIFTFLQLMIWGFIGAVISGILLLPQDLETKIVILFGVCLGLFFIPLCILIYILSEKVWYKASGAEKIVESTKA